MLSSLGLCGTLFGLDALTTHHQVEPIAVASLATGLVALVLYVFHARRVDNPILDLALLKLTTFRVSVTGGSFFRFGVGAVPFLLPLMMQEGFGYTPFQSGLITFVSSAGSFGMRTMSRTILRRFGFRQVIVVDWIKWGQLLSCSHFFDSERPFTSRRMHTPLRNKDSRIFRVIFPRRLKMLVAFVIPFVDLIDARQAENGFQVFRVLFEHFLIRLASFLIVAGLFMPATIGKMQFRRIL